MTEQTANVRFLTIMTLDNLGQAAYDLSIRTLTDEVVTELSLPVEADGFGHNEDAARKFVSELLNDPGAFAEFIDNNANVNLSEPLDVNGDYAE